MQLYLLSICNQTTLSYWPRRLCSMSPGLKSPLLLALYAVELLMVFLMAADGNRERLALGLGVQRSFNKSQSVQCHYINIFWSITAKVRWCSFAQEPVVWGHGRNIWRCKAGERKQKQDGRREKKKSQVHLNPCRHPPIRDGVSLIIYRLYCVMPISTNRRGRTATHGETCNLLPSVEMKSRYTKKIRSYDYSLLRRTTRARPVRP